MLIFFVVVRRKLLRFINSISFGLLEEKGTLGSFSGVNGNPESLRLLFAEVSLSFAPLGRFYAALLKANNSKRRHFLILKFFLWFSLWFFLLLFTETMQHSTFSTQHWKTFSRDVSLSVALLSQNVHLGAVFLAHCLKDKIKEFLCFLMWIFARCFVLLAHIAVIIFRLIALDLEKTFLWCVRSFIIYDFFSFYFVFWRRKLAEICLFHETSNGKFFVITNFSATYANTRKLLRLDSSFSFCTIKS